MFSRIEASAVFDKKDEERIRAAERATTPNRTQSPNRGKPPTNTTPRRTTPTAKPANTTPRDKQAQELQQKLALSEAIVAKLHKRNQELQLRVDELEKAGGASPAPGADGAAGADGSAARSRPVPLQTPELKLVKAQVKTLTRQLEELRAVDVGCIEAGAATGKVNKEVKAFFVTTRAKLQEDAAHHEVERAAWNRRLLDAEAQLCDAQCGRML